MTAADASSPIPSPRDGRLDVLRGLCLANMVLIHLLGQGMATPWLVHEVAMNWLRFAAGGFVMTSGLCIGAIHYRRALEPSRRLRTYTGLAKRAGLVLLVHYFATFLSFLLIPIHGQPVENVPKLVHDVLVFYSGYDLLLFYVFMLLVSPIIIEAARRIGVRWVLLASVAIFFWHYDNPYLSLWANEKDFPLVRWQLIFVAGLLIGARLPAYDALAARTKWRLLASMIATATCIAALSAAQRGGLMPAPWWLAVTKMPLSILEVAHYVALALAMGIAVDRLWPRLQGTPLERALRVIGVQSLLLWVVHVPIVANLAPLAWPIAIGFSLGGIWAAAAAASWAARQWADSLKSLPRLGYVAPVLGSVAIVGLLTRYESPVIPTSSDYLLAATPFAGPVAPMAETAQPIAGQAMSTDENIGDALPIPIDDDSLGDTA